MLATRDPSEVARQLYFSILADQSLAELRYEWADEFYSELPEGVQGYIDSKRRGRAAGLGPEASPLMAELIEVRQKLRPYWDIRIEVLKERGLEGVLSLSPAQRLQWEQSRPGLRVAQIVQRRRTSYLRRSQAAEQALIDWGYRSRPVRGGPRPQAPELPEAPPSFPL